MLRPISQPIPSREPSPFPPSAIDRVNAKRPDEQFEPHSWEELKQVIAENRLEVLRRWPSDVRRYLEWAKDVKIKYGSVQSFVIKNRLGWTPSSKTTTESGPVFDYASRIPFEDSSDYKILPNDWPYGFDTGITHLIVWLKNRLESEPIKGDMTPNVRQQVDEFVQWKFVDRVKDLTEPDDRIQWFKNWTALQSVPGMDHIHVLVRDIPNDIIKEWTEGEEPHVEFSEKAGV